MKCICPETVLTNERSRKFSARARAYTSSYIHLSSRACNTASIPGGDPEVCTHGNGAEKQQLLYKEIEQLMKKFKTLQCALDFDSGFIKADLVVDLT
jgi:hypothetical protein